MSTRMCFKKTGEPRKGIHPRYLKCREKVCYRYLRDAVQAADRYVERISVLMAPMVPYYCPAHSCWHIGHDKKWKGDLPGNMSGCVSSVRNFVKRSDVSPKYSL